MNSNMKCQEFYRKNCKKKKNNYLERKNQLETEYHLITIIKDGSGFNFLGLV